MRFAGNVDAMYKKILKGKLEFPESGGFRFKPVKPEGRAFIMGFLNTDPTTRLGGGETPANPPRVLEFQ